MGRFLEKFDPDHPAYSLSESEDGYLLVRRPGYEEPFNAFARKLINDADTTFAVFPTTDGAAGYEQLYVIEL
jgi:hypothetical protein